MWRFIRVCAVCQDKHTLGKGRFNQALYALAFLLIATPLDNISYTLLHLNILAGLCSGEGRLA